MGTGRIGFLVGCWLVAGVAAASASETGPVIVLPGKRGVPVYLYGRDISYAVVEGDWGLDRPSNTDPHVIYPVRVYRPYFPSLYGERFVHAAARRHVRVRRRALHCICRAARAPVAVSSRTPAQTRYFPSTGVKPRYGRDERDGPSRPVQPAQAYRRSWNAQSQPTPVTIPPPYPTPPIVVAPNVGPRH